MYYSNKIIVDNKKDDCIDYMKKQSSQPHPQSCAEMSKYKFIPPSKLMKTKEALNQATNNNYAKKNKDDQPNHYNSLIQVHDYDREEFESVTLDFNMKKNHKISQHTDHQCLNHNLNPNLSNKQNEKNMKKQQKVSRSISSKKLVSSNSRHSILSNKNPPLLTQLTKQQNSIQKLTQTIEQNKKTEIAKNSQILALREQNILMSAKLQKANTMLLVKNKQIAELNLKIQQLEGQIKQKGQQYLLIIQSLKKIIQSQVAKINQLKRNNVKVQKVLNYHKNLNCEIQSRAKTQSQSNYYIDNQSNAYDSNMRKRGQIQSSQSSKGTKFIKILRNEKKQPQIDRNHKIIDQQNLKNESRVQYPTPNFGARTPQSLIDSQLQGENYEQLQSSLLNDHANLTLSRISQSVQEYLQTSREDSRVEDDERSNKRVRTSMQKQSTHQQLLDEIDQYLSKKVVVASRK